MIVATNHVRSNSPFLTVAVFIPLLGTAAAYGGSIWIEGEAATKKSVTKHPWYDVVKKDGMSGAEWLSHYDSKPGSASYLFNASEPGEHTFWWRGNPFASKVSY
jgi:hypothetical protein